MSLRWEAQTIVYGVGLAIEGTIYDLAPHILRVHFDVKEDIPPNPPHISLFCAVAVMLSPQDVP